MTGNETSERLPKAQLTLATILDYLGLEATVKAEDKNGEITLFTTSEDAGRIIGKKGQTLHSLELIVNRMLSKNDIDCPRVSIDVDGYTRRAGSTKTKEGGRRPERRHGGGPRSDREDREPREDKGEREAREGDRDRDRGGESDDSASGKRGGKPSEDADERLTRQALDAAKEVKRWGDPITLPQMNSHDRRIVHMTLKDDPEIKTESIGNDPEDRIKTIVISLKET